MKHLLRRSALAQSLLLLGFFGAGNVLEEFLDQVDVGENHTSAAIAGEADAVKCLADHAK